MNKFQFRKFIYKIFVISYRMLLRVTGKLNDKIEYPIIFFRFLSVFKKSYYYEIEGHRVYYNPVRSGVGWVAFFNKSFEQDELEQCRKLIKEDDVVLDIGANIGSHSIFFSTLATKGVVYAFEPSRFTFEYLIKNVKRIENVIPLSIALSNTNEVLSFYECDNDVMSGLKNTDRSNITYVNKVPAVQADTMISTLNLSKLDFVKVDVEGLETEVMQGFKESLIKFKPIVFCEIYSGTNSNPDPDKTIQLIISYGYDAFILKNNKLEAFVNHNDDYHNYFFFPKKA